MMDANSILNVWDNCIGIDQTSKGVALASLAFKETDHSNIVDWSIEKRDVGLFHVRKALFGDQFNNISICPKCTQTVEWIVPFHQMAIPNLLDVPDNVEIAIKVRDCTIVIRLPNSNDLFNNNEIQIIQNCILNLKELQGQAFNQRIPEELMNAINDQFNQRCHASNISYQLNCIECKHEWQVIFDIVSYLWKEIDQWAEGFLVQICSLAKAFGWSESDILNMSENRRNHYLNLLNS